jgi:hypothetical protein
VLFKPYSLGVVADTTHQRLVSNTKAFTKSPPTNISSTKDKQGNSVNHKKYFFG